jgi:hypothetical protein
MDSNLSAVTQIDDLRLIELIGSARKRLVFMTPGMSKEVAEAFSYKWQELVQRSKGTFMQSVLKTSSYCGQK